MKSLYQADAAAEIQERLNRLSPSSMRQWGTMDAAQAMAHCSNAMENAIGDARPPRMFIGRLIGPMVKKMAIANDEPLKKNSPTSPELRVADKRQLDIEKQRLSGLIEKFVAAGPGGCTDHPHSFFGRMTADEWGVLMYKHVDHHLRQFGA
jgi:hypothetical protein